MSLRPRATIHLSNIVANWRALNALSGAGGAGAVVKADAYGHGAPRVSAALARAGCGSFFVAYGFEGEAVRAATGPGPAIYVFNGDAAVSHQQCRDHGLIPVLNSVAEVSHWCAGARDAPFALHVDTGMNRLGVRPEDLGKARLAMGERSPELIMTHFACADDPSSAMTARQCEVFETVASEWGTIPVSLSNSAGHWLTEDARRGLSRPGIALYGGGNSPARPDGLLPGMTLEAPILQVQSLAPGETVGYGASFRAASAMTVATVALGYGDGFLRSAGNAGFGALGDHLCPVVGRVSMDLVTIDVTAVAPLAKPGAWVEFIGAQADLETQAAAAGTLGYELTTGLGHRVERIYQD